MNRLQLALGGAALFASALATGLSLTAARESGRAARELDHLKQEVAQLTVLATPAGMGQPRPNVLTGFNRDVNRPVVSAEAFVDPMASVIGDVSLGARVYVAPFASIRGDEGQPIHIGDDANVQDGVVLHALETEQDGKRVPNRTYEVNGKPYAVYVGRRVSLAHQSQVHGPARVDDDVFIGMQALVFKSWVGRGSVLEPGAKVVGVTVLPGRYVPAGSVINTQAAADRLPEITEDYPFRGLNDAVVHVNTSFAGGYGRAAKPAGEGAEVAAAEGDLHGGH